eukprot:2655402-Pyramimonas_sp.AAC.1
MLVPRREWLTTLLLNILVAIASVVVFYGRDVTLNGYFAIEGDLARILVGIVAPATMTMVIMESYFFCVPHAPVPLLAVRGSADGRAGLLRFDFGYHFAAGLHQCRLWRLHRIRLSAHGAQVQVLLVVGDDAAPELARSLVLPRALLQPPQNGKDELRSPRVRRHRVS